MSVKVNLEHTNIDKGAILNLRERAWEQFSRMWDDVIPGSENDPTLMYTGWLDYPNNVTEEYLSQIQGLADEINRTSDYLLVIGTGGSYMGTKAVTDLIPGQEDKLIFLGYDFNSRRINEILNKIEGKDYSICIVSKSGSTMEPMVSSAVVLDKLKEKYGEEAYSRIYIITEDKKSVLRDFAKENNCNLLYIPENIGGRYSVFTAVGLLPMAVHGIDIKEFINGAKSLAQRGCFRDEGLDYAISRVLFHGIDGDKGDKEIEVFEVFDAYAEYLGNWLLQLFGESEGKDGKGLFPTLLIFNRDLHSIGQFLQNGSQVFFETMLFLGNSELQEDVILPPNPFISCVADRPMRAIVHGVEEGVVKAHSKAGIPLITIGIEKLSPRNIGELMYFFMVQSAVSALLLGVNPFNQPDVEKYKKEVKRIVFQKD